MPEEVIYGWLITVERTGASAEIYNVAILEVRQAMEAVRRVLPDRNGAVVKVKSKLTRQMFKALKMQPGDVMRGARKQRPRLATSERAKPEAQAPPLDGNAPSRRRRKDPMPSS